MVQGPLCLRRLLVQQVVQNVFVSLDEPLRVLLSVLQLLVPVALDPLEQRRQGQLLGVSQLGFLLLQDSLHLGLQLVPFKFLKQVRLHLDLLGLFIALDPDKLGLLVAQLEQVL